MNPRLPTSKKWTAFPPDFNTQIKESLLEAFGDQLKDAEIIIEGRIYPQEIVLRLGFLEAKRLKQNNFEVSIDYKQDQAVQTINDAIDAAASMMADFLENEGEVDFPKTWKEYDFENRKIYCQYSTVNTKLEAEADRLLGLDDDKLVKAAEDEDDNTSEDPESAPPRDKSKLH